MESKTYEYSELEIQGAIQATLQGHTHAFSKIYDAYYKMVFSIIRRIVKPSYSELDDIINEAFFLIYKGLRNFKGDSKFSTYAYRIVLNYAFKVSKKKSLNNKTFVLLGENDQNGIEQIPSQEILDNSIINKNSIEQALSSLTKELQTTIDLYYYDQYSVKEIAEIMKSTESATKNRLYQARNKIKLELSKGGPHRG